MGFILGFVLGIVYCVADSKYGLTEKAISKIKEFFNVK